MQKAQIPCHHINYNLQYRPANILWQQNENMPCNDAYNRKNHQIASSILPLYGEIQEKTRQIATRRQITSIYSVNLQRGRSFYKTKSIRRRFITCIDMHENSIIKQSILFEILLDVRKFNYKTSQYFENSIIKHLNSSTH